MPYSGTGDPGLPSNVRGLSDKRKKQWISVYDSARKRGADEGAAIKMANGVVKRELDHSTGAAGRRSIDDLVLEGWDVEDALDAEVVTRWSDDLTDTVGGESAPAAAVGVEAEGGERSVSVLEGLMAFFGHRRDMEPTRVEFREMPDGRLRYYAIASNNYQDRGDLVFPAGDQERYAAWVRQTGRYPELWQWHARGSRFGQADQLWFGDHFQFTSGLIDLGKEELAHRVFGKRDIAMSHGYVGRHVQLPDGSIEVRDFLQFEQSVLPRKAAANYGTYFSLAGGARGVEGEQVARFTDEQRQWFRSNGESDERISEMERMTSEMQDFFSRRNVDFRSIELADGSPAASAASVAAPVGAASAADVTPPAAAGGVGGGSEAAGSEGGAATPPAAGLTEDDVRRIALAAVEPVLASVRAIEAGVRTLQESDDARVAGHWASRAATMPSGFRPSQSGPPPVAGSREAAAVGAGGANAGESVGPLDSKWLDQMFGMHPMLGGGNGAGPNMVGGGQ